MVAIATFQSLLLDGPYLIHQAAEQVFRAVKRLSPHRRAMSEATLKDASGTFIPQRVYVTAARPQSRHGFQAMYLL